MNARTICLVFVKHCLSEKEKKGIYSTFLPPLSSIGSSTRSVLWKDQNHSCLSLTHYDSNNVVVYSHARSHFHFDSHYIGCLDVDFDFDFADIRTVEEGEEEDH